MSDPSTTDQRDTKPQTKQSQRRRTRPSLVYRRAAQIPATQLTLPFASQVEEVQASDADIPCHAPGPVSANPRGKQTYIYNYLRWAGR